MADVKIKVEDLKDKVNLSDDEQAAIAADALAEIEEAEAGKSKDKDSDSHVPDPDPDDDKKPKKEGEDTSDKKDEPSAEEVQKKADLAARAKELGLAEDAKEEEVTAAEGKKKLEDKEKDVEAYAKEFNVPVEEARKDLEHADKILEKYKGDPKQLAKANLHMQRLYTKTQEDLKALKTAAPSSQSLKNVTVDQVMEAVEKGQLQVADKVISREEMVEAYRKANVKITESLDDEEVFKIAAKEYLGAMVKQAEDSEKQIAEKGKAKRETFFNALAEADKKYIPEIKEVIEHLSDMQLAQDNVDVGAYLKYVKGSHYDEDIKAAREEAFKKGQEQAKILGSKPASGSDGTPKGDKKGSITLNEEQKRRAVEMYGSVMSDEEAYKAYVEYLAEEEKDKKK